MKKITFLTLLSFLTLTSFAQKYHIFDVFFKKMILGKQKEAIFILTLIQFKYK